MLIISNYKLLSFFKLDQMYLLRGGKGEVQYQQNANFLHSTSSQWDGCNPYQSSGEYFDQSCVPGLWFIRVVKTYVLVPLVSEMCFLFEDLVNSLCIEKNNNLEINSY